MLMFAVGVFTLLNAIGIGYSLDMAKLETERGVSSGFVHVVVDVLHYAHCRSLLVPQVQEFVRCLLEKSAPGAEGTCDRNDFYNDMFFIGGTKHDSHTRYKPATEH